MKTMLIIHYIVLILILSGGVAGFYNAAPNILTQFIVGVVTSVAYIIWGVVYHALKKDLHTRVMVEYVLISAIAIVLLATVLWS